MTALEIFQYVSQLTGDGLRIKRKYPVNDMISAGLVSGIEVAGFGRRLERPYDDPRRIRTQIKSLTIQERELRQNSLLLLKG